LGKNSFKANENACRAHGKIFFVPLWGEGGGGRGGGVSTL